MKDHSSDSSVSFLAIQFNRVASVVEHAPDLVSKLNIRCNSVDLVKQLFVVDSVVGC